MTGNDSANLNVVVIGSRELTLRVIEHLLDENWSLVGAIGAAGSVAAGQAGYKSLKGVCDRNDVPFLGTDDISESAVETFLRDLNPDICLCCGWSQIVPRSVLSIPTQAFLGIHASSLPEDRGGAPVNWQIIRGDENVGLSLFEFVEELDHGDIYGQTTVPIEDRDDIATVYAKVTNASTELLDEVLAKFADGTVEGTPQRFEDASYLPMRTPDDGIVDWDRSADRQHDWIRALTTPYPGAVTFLEGDRVIILESEHLEKSVSADEKNGTVIGIEPGHGIDVVTGGEVLRLTRVQTEPAAPEWADEFATRHGIEPGTTLGTPADFPDWLYTGIRDTDGGFDYKTSVECGGQASFKAVCCSHDRPRTVRVSARFDDKEITDETLTVDGWTATTLEAGPNVPGAHSLTVQFEHDDETVDTRFLKVYSYGGPVE